jgi:UDP-N-acetylmuramyl pentapeptide synthase
MTTELQEPKNAAESGKVMEWRGADTRHVENSSLTLGEVFSETGATVPPAAHALKIQSIVCDSRKAATGSLFFALQGVKEDGNRYIRDAIERGAIAIASESGLPARVGKPQESGDCGGELFRASCEISAVNRGDWHKRKNHHRFAD